jgi:hypothetical protein
MMQSNWLWPGKARWCSTEDLHQSGEAFWIVRRVERVHVASTQRWMGRIAQEHLWIACLDDPLCL